MSRAGKRKRSEGWRKARRDARGDSNLSNIPAVAYLHRVRGVVWLFLPLYFGLLTAVALGCLWLEAPKPLTECCRAPRLFS